MPRGKPRKGQYVIELVMPNGDRIKWESTHDLNSETWCDSLSKVLTQATDIVASVKRKSSEPAAIV